MHSFGDFPLISDGEDKSCPFKNSIRKNYKHVRKWAKRTRSNCFRIYDRHVTHYPLAIDYYAGRYCVHYFAPKSAQTPEPAEDIVQTVTDTLSELLGAEPEEIYWRQRYRRDKMQQYEKQAEEKEFFVVYEHGVPFWINLTDYLDTGLFLDHRQTRQIVAKASIGKRLLNLFAYTCSFSVHAAVAGAASTHSVDLSNTYTDWGLRNLRLNQQPRAKHSVERADCLKFLKEARQKSCYDVIVIDPPTISRSKKMQGMFDIAEHYPELISGALELLAPGGLIYFSTNSRQFSFDKALFPDYSIQDISDKTRPFDFRDSKIHQCWRISRA